jgi:ribosomal protein S18 acetylase RimI-like enzyme
MIITFLSSDRGNDMIRIEQVKSINPEIIQAIQLLFPQLTQFSPIPDKEAIQKMVNSQASSLWIARNESGHIIGMLSLAIYRTTTGVHGWIEDVVVDQKARRQGVAGQLTQAAVEFAQQNEAKAVSLTSRPERAAANQLYQNLGFELVKTNLYRKKLI